MYGYSLRSIFMRSKSGHLIQNGFDQYRYAELSWIATDVYI